MGKSEMGSDLSNHTVATATVHRAGGVVGADREHAAGADRNTGAEHLGIDPFPRSAARKTHAGEKRGNLKRQTGQSGARRAALAEARKSMTFPRYDLGIEPYDGYQTNQIYREDHHTLAHP